MTVMMMIFIKLIKSKKKTTRYKVIKIIHTNSFYFIFAYIVCIRANIEFQFESKQFMQTTTTVTSTVMNMHFRFQSFFILRAPCLPISLSLSRSLSLSQYTKKYTVDQQKWIYSAYGKDWQSFRCCCCCCWFASRVVSCCP